MKWYKKFTRLFNKLKIGIKILIVLFLLLVLFFSIMGINTYSTSKDSLENMVQTLLEEKASDNADLISTIMSSEFGKLRMIANNEEVKTMNWIQQAKLIKPFQKNSDYYEIFVADVNGETNSTNSMSSDIANEDYFKKAVNGKEVISDPMLNDLYNKTVNVYAVPIYDEEEKEVIGVLGAVVNYSVFADIVKNLKVGEDGYSFLINEEGTTVGHRDETLVLNFNNDIENLRNNDYLKELVNIEKELIAQENVYDRYSTKEKEIITKEDGTEEYGKTLVEKEYFIAGERIPGSDWYILINAPVGEMLEEAEALKGSFVLQVIIYLVLAIGIIFIFIQFLVVKPVRRLVTAMDKLKIGDTEVSITAEGEDEISILSKAILTVVDNIKIQTEALDRLSEGDLEEYKNIEVRSEKDIQNKSLIKIGDTLNKVLAEVDKLTHAAIDGDLSKRGLAQNYNGGFRELIEGINNTLDAMVMPITEAIDVLEKFAEGDLKASYKNEYKGDHKKLQLALEKTMSNLSVYIEEISYILSHMANGNMDLEIQNDYVGDFKPIQLALDEIINNLNEMFLGFKRASDEVLNGSEQVYESSQDISNGATEQASSVQELTASVSQISTMATENADNSNKANDLITRAKQTAGEGDREMNELLEAMEEINKASENIEKVLKVIDNLAFQTNILAINASVEAARAGKHGKGFQVVAQSVRNLSNKSAENAKETAELIRTSITKTKTGTEIAEKTASALKEIIENVDKSAEIVDSISKSSNEQAQGVEQIDKGLMEISKVVQSNSAISEETASASEQLSNQAKYLNERLSSISVKEEEKIKKSTKSEETEKNDE